MSNMEDFESLDNMTTEQGTAGTDDGKKDAKKAKNQKFRAAFKETLDSDASYEARHCKWTPHVQVVNTLGFGDSGNIVREPNSADKKSLMKTSAIVGYLLMNTGDEPINYTTEEFTQDETGKYIGTKVQKVMQPGEKVALSRKYMTMFCAQAEISFQLANGIVCKGSGSYKEDDIDAELRSYYFKFSDTSIKVNDDAVKLNIGEKVKVEGSDAEKWVVKAEYEAVFGDLNNSEEKKGKTSKTKYNVQDLASNYINKLIEQSAM